MSKNENLAKNIARLRKKKGLSQEKLARLADVANFSCEPVPYSVRLFYQVRDKKSEVLFSL